jgi:methyltransferase (TIGR00027 family)
VKDAPSRTAERVALRRAAHQILDRPKVFNDPLAVAIAGASEFPPETPLDRLLRAFMAARSRYAEDQLALAAERGVRQYVVLGAGLDTYAYRSAPGIRVFEVDHPATQAWKRSRLQDAGIAIPDSMTFVAVDFERHSLADELSRAGFKMDQPAFFSWLGVIMYLTLEAATETLRFIAARPPGSGVTFDYATETWEPLARRVARAGEPFRLFFDPTDLARLLHKLGFNQLEDLDGPKINARYFRDRTDGLQVAGNRGHLITAWVGQPAASPSVTVQISEPFPEIAAIAPSAARTSIWMPLSRLEGLPD